MKPPRPLRPCLTTIAVWLCAAWVCASTLDTSPAWSQPLVRQTNDISLIGAPNLPGVLAVSLMRGKTSTIRLLDLEAHRVLEFPAPVGNVGYPFFSPDGEYLAFVGTTRRGEEVFASRWSGENVQRISFNSVLDGNPSWSAEGDSVIYFSENRRYKSEIFSALFNAPFTRTQLTNVGGGNTTPRESPDNHYLLYTTDRYAPAWNICLIDVDTRKESCPLRGSNSSNCRANWSPDGAQFVYTLERGSSVDLHVYTVASRKSEKITSLSHKEYDAAWSPDGKYIAFSHDPKGTMKYDLKVVRLSDKAIIPIAKANGSLRYVSWSTARSYTVATDLCPADPSKTKPGTCGCGAPDTDTDKDTVPDCIDGCPANPKRHRSQSCN